MIKHNGISVSVADVIADCKAQGMDDAATAAYVASCKFSQDPDFEKKRRRAPKGSHRGGQFVPKVKDPFSPASNDLQSTYRMLLDNDKDVTPALRRMMSADLAADAGRDVDAAVLGNPAAVILIGGVPYSTDPNAPRAIVAQVPFIGHGDDDTQVDRHYRLYIKNGSHVATVFTHMNSTSQTDYYIRDFVRSVWVMRQLGKDSAYKTFPLLDTKTFRSLFRTRGRLAKGIPPVNENEFRSIPFFDMYSTAIDRESRGLAMPNLSPELMEELEKDGFFSSNYHPPGTWKQYMSSTWYAPHREAYDKWMAFLSTRPDLVIRPYPTAEDGSPLYAIDGIIGQAFYTPDLRQRLEELGAQRFVLSRQSQSMPGDEKDLLAFPDALSQSSAMALAKESQKRFWDSESRLLSTISRPPEGL